MLHVKIFTLRFSDATEGFDDNSIRAFMADKEIVSLKEQFFFKDTVPYWSIMVVYKADLRPTGAREEYLSDRDRRTEEYRCLLTEESTPLFNLLRQWRNERAKKDVSPAYIVFTNRQLAHIAAQSPDTLNQLSEVEGVG
jgi:superfamily II DNA helicase RecQ